MTDFIECKIPSSLSKDLVAFIIDDIFNSVDEKYKTKFLKKYVEGIFQAIFTLLDKDNSHIVKDREYFKEIYFYFFDQDKDDLFEMSENTENIYNLIENNLLIDINKLDDIASEINHKSTDGFSLLLLATMKNNFPIVEKLVNLGATLHSYNDDMTSLDHSIKNKNKEITKFLLDKGAYTFVKLVKEKTKTVEFIRNKINKEKNSICKCCETWYSNRISKKAIKVLIKISNNIEITEEEFQLIIPEISYKNCEDWSFLYMASEKGNINMVKKLVDNGANVNQMCNDYSPLFVAILNNRLEIVKYLISKGAHINFITRTTNTTFKGKNLIELAILQGYKEICKILFDNGVTFKREYLKMMWDLEMKDVICYTFKKFDFKQEEQIEIISYMFLEYTNKIFEIIIKKRNQKFGNWSSDDIKMDFFLLIIDCSFLTDEIIIDMINDEDCMLKRIELSNYFVEWKTFKNKNMDLPEIFKILEYVKENIKLDKKMDYIMTKKQKEEAKEIKNKIKEEERIKKEEERLKKEEERIKKEEEKIKKEEDERRLKAEAEAKLIETGIAILKAKKEAKLKALVEAEAREKEAKLMAEKQAREKEAKLMAEKQAREKEAKLMAEKEAREKEAKLMAEKQAREEVENNKENFGYMLADYIASYPLTDNKRLVTLANKLDDKYKKSILKDINNCYYLEPEIRKAVSRVL